MSQVGTMLHIIEQNKAALADLSRQFGIERLELFGSACTSDFDPSRSDIDFLVEFPPGYDFGPWASRFTEFQQALSELLGRRVDLVMTSALSNVWLRREIEKTRLTIYHAPEVAEVA
jgi:predicted nucleotidyltransferase